MNQDNISNMELLSTMNLVDSVIDEIALEGLDGITLEALWNRLALRFREKIPLSRQLTEQIWNICLQVRELSFYELEKERDKLIIFDRYEFVDPDIGIILESDNMPDDIYVHCPIDDWKNGIIGSCSTYYTRKDIGDAVKNLSVHEAEKMYGRKLVIVGSQAARQNSLMDKSVCPTLELTVMQYCFLERVGRSRYHGEVTQGKLSLSLLKEDPRSLFYHRKFLLRHKLVTKQTHHQKSSGHSCSGSLLHLTRFYVERKPKVIFLAERVIDILKSRENQVAEYSEIKKELRIENSIKKLFKTSFFQRFVKTDLLVPWRTLYPQASDAEWQCKNNAAKEKSLRVVQLIDPNVEKSDLWKDDVIIDDDDPYELDISQQLYSVPFLKQANVIVEASKDEGLGQTELAKKMGLPKLQARSIFRNLAKVNIVATYMNDMGRQRVTKYVSRKFESGSRMSEQFQREMSKMKKLTELPIERKKEMSVEKCFEEKSKSLTGENKNDELLNEMKNTETQIICPTASRDDNSRLFHTATKILRKYKLKGCKRNYKRTFCNVAEMDDSVIEAKRRKLIKTEKQNDELKSNVESTIPDILTMKEFEEKLLMSETASSQRPTNDIIGLKDFSNPEMKKVSNVTYRLLKRANMIMEAVKEHKVVDDMTKLIKVISEEEEREGYDVKIDKKSLIRLLQRLAKDNLVKNIKLKLSANNKEKSLTFICDPSIDVNHTVIRSAVEQAKIKFCLIGAQKVKTILQSNTEKLELSSESTDKIETMEKLSGNDKVARKKLPPNLVYDTKAGRRYGYAPKFIRMQALHAYLFYIIYEHPGKPRESQEKLIEILRTKGVSIDEKLEKDMSEIFNTEVGWKMFVPPLPKHNGWPNGWALMCDLLLRMPLSIFLKIHKVSYSIPELEEYTNNPIRKHLLMKDMPGPMRNVLLIRRKYIFSVHDTITRLCYMGLLQFGPQKFKEKDKVFIYLNRRTELLDTTTSAAHYHKIEAKIYPVIRYTFTSLQTIDKYWYKLWTTCVNTRLGGRLVVTGKDIVLEDLTKKYEMIEATKPRTAEEASLMDNNNVPGDRMGAAGIDSAFFAHLKRNWNWESSNYPFQRLNGHFDRERTNLEGERDIYMSRVKHKPVKFTDFHGLKRINGPTVIDAIDLRKTQTKNVSDNNASTLSKPKHNRVTSLMSGANSRQRSYVRRVLPRRKHVRPRVKYDEIDYSALQLMDKLRVDWDTREDNILLVCKVAMMYLCPNPRSQLIGFTSVRDVLRSYSPVMTSYNKTSRACQRRLLYMLKKSETHHSVTLGVEELKQDFYVNRRYGDIIEKLKKEYRGTHKFYERVNLVFRDLVAHIAKKHYDITDIKASTLSFTPMTVEEFHLFHRVKYPKRASTVQGFHDDTTTDIHSSTINSVIHSSMCCVKDRRSWAYQLFRIYQQYPEWLLRSAMAKIRTDQMVTIKKNYVFAIRKQSNTCMPMSSSQYQLSSGYVQKFNTKLPFSVFKEAWDLFIKLTRHYSENYVARESTSEERESEKTRIDMITSPINGGTIAAIQDFINLDGLDFDVEIPRHIIMLDPSLQKDDERYIRIARRYQDLLRNLEHVDVDGILEGRYNQDSRAHCPEPVVPASQKIINSAVSENNDQRDKTCAQSTSSCLPKDSNNTESDLDTRKIRQVAKYQDPQETNVNTDTEAFESEHEINFDDEDCYDEIEENDLDDDDLICFIDGTRIRLTRQDIVNSGFEINSENSRGSELTSRHENERARENSSSKKIRENCAFLEDSHGTRKKLIREEISRCVQDNDSEMEIESSVTTRESLVHEGIFISGENNILEMKIEHSDETCKTLRREGISGSVENNNSRMEIESSHGMRQKLAHEETLFGGEKNISKMEIENSGETSETSEHREISSSSKNNNSLMEIELSQAEKNNVRADETRSGDVRVNELIDRANCTRFDHCSYYRTGDANDVQKRYTRLAMLQMREELNDLATNDNHHAHEYFVLNMFNIFYSFQRSRIEKPLDLTTIQELQLPNELLPLDRDRYSSVIADLRKFAIFPKAIESYEKFKEDSQMTDVFKRELDAVYEFICDRREVGASLLQLSTKFYSILGDELYDILSVLKESRMVLRSGVTNTRYIHQKYADPWLIHSYKIMRLQKEGQQTILAGSLYVVTDERSKDEIESKETSECRETGEDTEKSEGTEAKATKDMTESKELDESLESNEVTNTTEENVNDSFKKNSEAVLDDSEAGKSIQGKMQKSRTCLLPTKDIYRAAKQLDLDTAEEIRVVVRPWIRIDGALNRRVLDRMLGGVLAYCLIHPGIHLTKVQEKFSPAIQPFHTKELVEILMRLECLKMGSTRKNPVTLFSKPSSRRVVFSCEPERSEWSEEQLVVEPMLGATLKFSMFLSNRTYTFDFLA